MLRLVSDWQAALEGVFADRNIRLWERSRQEYRKWLVKVFGFIGKTPALVAAVDQPRLQSTATDLPGRTSRGASGD